MTDAEGVVGLSLRFGKPETPPCMRSLAMPVRRPVSTLWA
jgi:hypothetical protein